MCQSITTQTSKLQETNWILVNSQLLHSLHSASWKKLPFRKRNQDVFQITSPSASILILNQKYLVRKIERNSTNGINWSRLLKFRDWNPHTKFFLSIDHNFITLFQTLRVSVKAPLMATISTPPTLSKLKTLPHSDRSLMSRTQPTNPQMLLNSPICKKIFAGRRSQPKLPLQSAHDNHIVRLH